MSQVLTGQVESNASGSVPLTNVPNLPFKLSVARSLDNNYTFGKMKQKSIKDFHAFIENTIGKKLTISQVDALYLRKRGLKKEDITQRIDGVDREVMHYGRDRHPFRIFGFYDRDHFVLTRIDCNHKTNS